MVFEKIRAIICDKFALEESAVTPETSFVEDLSADSLDMVEVIMALEEEFEIGEVPEEELGGMKTVGDAVNFIAGRMK